MPAAADPTPASDVLLTVDRLSRPGLGPASFVLDAGECLAVSGPSGSGKTLLLRAIADLDPAAGSVRLGGRECGAMPAPEWRRQVVYVAAEPAWWAPRVRDHFPDPAAAPPLLDGLGLPAAAMDWPAAQPSTGERQRLALARALARRPRVLLLDEPTGPLDRAAARRVEAVLRERLEAGLAILLVTHDRAMARRLARRALHVEGGRVTEGRP